MSRFRLKALHSQESASTRWVIFTKKLGSIHVQVIEDTHTEVNLSSSAITVTLSITQIRLIVCNAMETDLKFMRALINKVANISATI